MAEHINNRISRRKFYLARKDLKELRGKYRNINKDLPNGMILSASRRVMIDAIVRNEFEDAPVDAYNSLAAEWRVIDVHCNTI